MKYQLCVTKWKIAGSVKNVANYDRWPGCRGGQLYSFNCINMTEFCSDAGLVHKLCQYGA
jgi:hypothetical protein